MQKTVRIFKRKTREIEEKKIYTNKRREKIFFKEKTQRKTRENKIKRRLLREK